MITIKCTQYEKRKLCADETNIMCNICYTLGACKEFDARCSKCKRNRSKYIKWEIISKPKKKSVSSKGDGSSCCNCWANECGMCIENSSPFYKMPIEKIIKIQPHCDVYGAYEGDG